MWQLAGQRPRRQGQKGRQKSRAGQRRQNSLLARSRGRTPLGAPAPDSTHLTRLARTALLPPCAQSRAGLLLAYSVPWLSKVKKVGSGEGGGREEHSLLCQGLRQLAFRGGAQLKSLEVLWGQIY